MASPYEIYDLLRDYASGPARVREILIGLVWTYCEADTAGLAMSPGIATRTLPWCGTLRGKALSELTDWVQEFEPYRAAIGMAAVNAGINQSRLLPQSVTLEPGPGAQNNLSVFKHFLPRLRGTRVVVVGRYPGLHRFVSDHGLDVTVLEREPGPHDLPAAASEYLLRDAEWVFLTASSIPNKTFPRLAELSRNAITVLMGPTTPWLPELYHFGIDFLAGVDIVDAAALRATVGEGGGVRIFDGPVRYRVAELGLEGATEWTRQLIARTALEKEKLLRGMSDWYEKERAERYPGYDYLESANRRLARLDTCFKRLWDGQTNATKPGNAVE